MRSLPIAAAMLVLACGGKEQAGPSPEALNKLVDCQQELARSKTAADMCTKQLDEAEQGAEGWVVTIEGDALTVTASPKNTGGGGPRLSDGQMAQLADSIVKQIRRSQSAIQQCYQQALKKDTRLQAVAVDLKVRVTVNEEGKVQGSSFSPTISRDFDGCMNTIAQRWTVPPFQGGELPIEATVKLQPAT